MATIAVQTEFTNVVGVDIPSTVQSGGVLPIDLTPESGYALTAVSVIWYGEYGDENEETLTITDTSHYSGVWNVPDDISKYDDIIIKATADQQKGITIINKCANTTYEYTKLTDNTYYFKLSPDDGYKIDSATATYINTSGIEFTDNFDVSTTPATCSVTTNEGTITLDGSTSEITKDVVINTSFIGVTAKDLPTAANYGEVISIDLTPNEGYKLVSAQIERPNEYGETVSDILTISDPNHLATEYTMPSGYRYGEITLVAVARLEVDPLDKYGTINGYCATNAVLRTFAKNRFFADSIGTGSIVITSTIDLGSYVVSLRKMSFNVPKGSEENVYFGKYQFDVKAPILAQDIVTHKYESVKIPTYSNTSHDNTNIYNIYLPFVGFKAIDGKYNGAKLTIEYTVSCVNGKGFVSLYIDDVLTYQYDCNVSQSIYYILSTDKVQTLGDTDFSIDNNKGLTPYLIAEHTNELPDKYPTDNTTGVISTFEGYSQFTDIELQPTANMTDSDYNSIITLLQSGVIL